MTQSLKGVPVLVVGAGIMGAGIAQVAAQAGHKVMLFDAKAGAAEEAKKRLAGTLNGLAEKGKMSSQAATDIAARISAIGSLSEAAAAGLVVEAVVENLQVKQSIFSELESIVGEDCLLATNTSSISVTAIARPLKSPGRLVGMHFFNPVPLMKLVEVVSGLHTDPATATAIFELSQAWGKVPVHARSTPGFIVNRIARPFYAETLALIQEQAGEAHVLDACLRAAGFRMGPCALMDLIGHDTNLSVTKSVFDANYGDKRFMPSLVQQELVDGGWFGRKTGRGFYRYPEAAPPPESSVVVRPEITGLVLHGQGPGLEALARRLIARGLGPVTRQPETAWQGIEWSQGLLMLTDGRTANEAAHVLGQTHLAVCDLPIRDMMQPDTAAATTDNVLAFSVPEQARQDWAGLAAGMLAELGYTPVRLADCPGLVVGRTTAMLINEAADAVVQAVCSEEGADAAMKLGVNYPAGPFEWLAQWSVAGVVQMLEALDRHYRGERYRVSPWLRRRQWLS